MKEDIREIRPKDLLFNLGAVFLALLLLSTFALKQGKVSAGVLPALPQEISSSSSTFYLAAETSPLTYMMSQSEPSGDLQSSSDSTISFYSDTWETGWELASGTTAVVLIASTEDGYAPSYVVSLKAGSDSNGWNILGSTSWVINTGGIMQEKTTSLATTSYTFREGERLVFEIQIPAFGSTAWDGLSASHIEVPTISAVAGATPTATATSTSTSTATSTATPDCNLLSEVTYYTDDKVFYSVIQNSNDTFPDLTRSILYWPDSTYDFHFVKFYFPCYNFDTYVYLHQNYYTSPVDSGEVNISWPVDARPTAEWAARFVLDDGTEISGAFGADLTFSFPSWGTCNLQVGDTTIIPSATPSHTPTASPTPTNTPTPYVSVSTNNVSFPDTPLNGADQILDGTTAAWSAVSTYNPGTSWHITISALDLTDGTHTISVSNMKIRLLESAITILSGSDKPSSEMESYTSLSTSDQTLLSYSGPEGKGSFEFAPEFQLWVAAETYSGAYQSTITTTYIAGP